jgi:hypothetical protein
MATEQSPFIVPECCNVNHSKPSMKRAWLNSRLAFQSEQIGELIDEYSGDQSTRGSPSMVDADRAKWDYHPIMSSRYVLHGKSDPGLFTGVLRLMISRG